MSDGFAEIFLKAVQLQSEYRYQHASDMRRDLERLIPSDEKKTVNQNFLSSKQAMLKGKFDEAIQYVMQGTRKEESGCKGLLVYCFYHEYMSNGEMVDKAIALLDELVYEGDAIVQCLRATIHWRNHEWEIFSAISASRRKPDAS